MGSEPTSAAHRYAEALGRSGAIAQPTPPTPPTSQPKSGKGRRIKVRVEGAGKAGKATATAKPAKKPPATGSRHVEGLTTTERLTSDERALLRELREVGPETAGQSVAAIRAAKRAQARAERERR